MLYDFTDIRKNKMILLFSGGYDSTSILLDLMESGCRWFECVYVKIPNNPEQTRYELKACKRILKHIKKKYGYDVPFRVIKTFEVLPDNNVSYCWPIFLLPPVAQIFDEDTKYVLAGFLRDSDIWHVYAQVEDLLEASSCIFRWSRYKNKKVNTKLFCPYEARFKYAVLDNLKKDKKLYNLCVTCCFPKKTKDGAYVACGECLKCVDYNHYK